MYTIRISEDAENSLKKLHIENKRKIIKQLKLLKENPEIGKKLTGELIGLRSLHIAKYRAIYSIDITNSIINVYAIGHRKDIYDKIKFINKK